jgi:hypothetical protein
MNQPTAYQYDNLPHIPHEVDFGYSSQTPSDIPRAYEPDGIQFAFGSALQAQHPGSGYTGSSMPSPAVRNNAVHNVALSNSAQNSSAPSMGPPSRPRKRKAPTLRADDWEPYKARVVELYVNQGLALKKVKEKIEEEFGFTAE